MSSTERNNTICLLYQEGVTQADLGIRFGITEAWVGQILKRAGIRPRDRTVSGERMAFIGVNVSEEAKEALRKICLDEETSMSQFMAALLNKEIQRRRAL